MPVTWPVWPAVAAGLEACTPAAKGAISPRICPPAIFTSQVYLESDRQKGEITDKDITAGRVSGL